uniref:YLP motif-containing protein 1 n=1 Tax=Kalanchoe fedtschenkoi TaxID=63787 RepID=A0A7N0V1S5_KALFE
MDHQWRPPPFQGNVCPTCSNSHFPFCPPRPPSFVQNPSFFAPHNQPFSGPGTDVYRGPMGIPLHGYADVRNWDRNPSVGGNGFNGGYNGGGGNGYVSCDYSGGSDDRSTKRVRIDEIGAFGTYANGQYQSNGNLSRPVSEEERRLKLIYDHGCASGGHQHAQLGSVERTGHGAHAAQNGGDWVPPHHALPHRDSGPMVHKMPISPYANPVESKDSYSKVAAPPYHGHSYGGTGVSSIGQIHLAAPQKFASPSSNMQGSYPRSHGMAPQNMNQVQPSQVFHVPPPLPSSPPPPLPMEPAIHYPYERKTSYQSSPMPSSLFPVHVGGSSPGVASPSYPPVLNDRHSAPPFVHNRIHFPIPAGRVAEDVRHKMPDQRGLEELSDMSKRWTSDKPKFIDAVHLFKLPHRATRPDHLVIILRGLPGSGKSYLAKMLRDIEVENGGEAPRIHSIDDYFMTEVEKPEECENSKSASSARGKKPTMKKVMEYFYEPEMEEAYRSSMLKAFKKSLEDGGFTFIIVDDRNLRVADFAQFWAIAKRSGYEVYVLEAPYKDPAGCAARNVHNFTLDGIQKMAGQWEEAPALYLQLDVKSLFHEDNLKETGIEEVDMDMEDEADPDVHDTQVAVTTEETEPSNSESAYDKKQGDDDEVSADHLLERAKELGRSKWSDELDDQVLERKDSGKRKTNALSGLIKSYGKRIKSVHWGDQAKDTGFSIGAVKKATQSLVIGPGPGYNLMTNPIQADDTTSAAHKSGNKQTAFQERLRAEHESFKVVFAKRKQKLSFVLEDE